MIDQLMEAVAALHGGGCKVFVTLACTPRQFSDAYKKIEIGRLG
jgi:hypothetical protein